MASATLRKPAMLAPACRCVEYSLAAPCDAEKMSACRGQHTKSVRRRSQPWDLTACATACRRTQQRCSRTGDDENVCQHAEHDVLIT